MVNQFRNAYTVECVSVLSFDLKAAQGELIVVVILCSCSRNFISSLKASLTCFLVSFRPIRANEYIRSLSLASNQRFMTDLSVVSPHRPLLLIYYNIRTDVWCEQFNPWKYLNIKCQDFCQHGYKYVMWTVQSLVVSEYKMSRFLSTWI